MRASEKKHDAFMYLCTSAVALGIHFTTAVPSENNFGQVEVGGKRLLVRKCVGAFSA